MTVEPDTQQKQRGHTPEVRTKTRPCSWLVVNYRWKISNCLKEDWKKIVEQVETKKNYYIDI